MAGIGITEPDSWYTAPASLTPYRGGGGGGGAMTGIGGLLGLLGGPLGGPLAGLAGGLIGLLGGDGGRGKRLREAQNYYRTLGAGGPTDKDYLKGQYLFQQASLPQLTRLYSQAARRVGLDSGLGHGYALGENADRMTEFGLGQYLAGRQEKLQRQLASAQGLASLV